MAKKADEGGAKVNKSEAIRRVLTEMGIDTSPKVVVERLAQEGIEVKAQVVSVMKGRMRGKASKVQTPGSDNLNVVELVAMAKTLKEQLGREQARKLIDTV